MPLPPQGPKPANFVSRAKRIRGKLPISEEEHRLNERIRVPEVRLIDEKGNQIGVVPTYQALQMARERNLDLMEVASGARPPVCKIIDYGRFKYEKKKKDTQAKKKQAVVKIKEVQFRPNTDTHDVDTKVKKLKEFLDEGDKVKITMLFRGRQMAHTQGPLKMMESLAASLKDECIIEAPPKFEGKKIHMLLAPVAKKK